VPEKKNNRTRAILLLAMAALVAAAYLLLEALFTPWARSLTGAPTLTGEWVGEMTTASGRRFQVWLVIRHAVPTGNCASCPRIEGEVRTCEAGGEQRRYRMWGDVDNWRGTRFLLKTLDEQEHARKLTLGALTGQWSEDVLDLTTDLRVPGAVTTMEFKRLPDGREIQRATGGDPDTHRPVRWRMARGTERGFDAACASLADRRSRGRAWIAPSTVSEWRESR